MPLLIVVLAAASALLDPTPAYAATFTVTLTTDQADPALNGVCDVDTVTVGDQCTLRAAIQEANNTPAQDLIHFNVGGGGAQTITVSSPLPTIVTDVDLLAGTQPSFSAAPLITLLGAGTAVSNQGLRFEDGADGSAVTYMAIRNFNTKIYLAAGADSITVYGNYLGNVGMGTNGVGEGIRVLSNNNTIGLFIQPNVISRNGSGGGVIVSGSNNEVNGNFIGTNPGGTVYEGNNGAGVSIEGGTDNKVFQNLIVPGPQIGISIQGSATTGTEVHGNKIGTNLAGTAALFAGQGTGIRIFNSPGNQIGGTDGVTPNGPCSGDCNLISGLNLGILLEGATANANEILGNFIGVTVNGQTALANNDGILVKSADNVIGGAVAAARNLVVSGLFAYAITVDGAGGNTIQGNRLGTNAAGTERLGEGDISLENAPSTEIGGQNATPGGACSGDCNLIADGVVVGGGLSTGVKIQGNYMNTNTAGTEALADSVNSGDNILLSTGVTGLVVGGSQPALRNVIAGSAQLIGPGMVVKGNYFGLTRSGNTYATPIVTGVGIESTGARLGGPIAEDGNVINGNVVINGDEALVRNNMIGVNPAGTQIRGGGSLIVAGDEAAVLDNVLSSQSSTAITITGDRAILRDNHIAADITGLVPLGCASVGVHLAGTDNLVTENVIGCAGRGVNVASGTKNAILNNTMSSVTFGIDLDSNGFTDNDAGDGDTGANNLQNYPELSAVFSGGGITAEGLLRSKPNQNFKLEFYSAVCDFFGKGGRSLLGKMTVHTDATGEVEFTFNGAGSLQLPDEGVTVTATDTNDNTSEFGACFTATARTPLKCLGVQATITGTEGDETITGTNGNDVIVALGGRDRVEGGAGKDRLCGGAGNDTLLGGTFADRLDGGFGRDRLMGEQGQDWLKGSADNDTLLGGTEDDTLGGGPGDDTCDGGTGGEVSGDTATTCETTTNVP
ncbi:MAG: calcium-binding protein [Dehalococcoidia bacterium]